MRVDWQSGQGTEQEDTHIIKTVFPEKETTENKLSTITDTLHLCTYLSQGFYCHSLKTELWAGERNNIYKKNSTGQTAELMQND